MCLDILPVSLPTVKKIMIGKGELGMENTNIYKVKAEHVMLPKIDRYIPEYMLDGFVCELSNAHYQDIDVVIMQKSLRIL